MSDLKIQSDPELEVVGMYCAALSLNSVTKL